MTLSPNEAGTEPLPINLRSEQPEERNRLTAGLRLIWVIPQFFVLYFVGIAAFFVLVAGWFVALFTGELPEFAENFLGGYLRWFTRVGGYFYFLTDAYPPYSLDEDPSYPIQIAIPPREPLNRLAVLFRIILVIPGAILGSVIGAGIGLLSVGSWFMITFTGAQPIPLYEATRVGIRYVTRLYGYFGMLTAEYPWGVLGDVQNAGETQTTSESGWTIGLSNGGRTATIVALVLGAVYVLYTNS